MRPRHLFSWGLILLLTACQQQKPTEEQTTTDNPIAYNDHSQSQYNGDSQRLITIAGWNIEWLGSEKNGPKNKTRQLENAIKILKYLHADLYCLCEIVDPASLEQLTRGLGPKYQYKLSNYASGVNSPSEPGYAAAQKLAFIYDTSLFKNVRSSALLKSDPRAGYNFAGGRYPFLLKTDLTVNQTREALAFILLHAKSGSDRTSYQRRLDASVALKKVLDQRYGQKPVMILGDFNDIMNGSIASGKPSPYQAFSQDPDYHVLTWEAAEQGQQSTLDYPTVIDQQMISAALNKYYVPQSLRIRTDVKQVVKDYSKGTTSDHYPVSSQFLINQAAFAKPPLKSSPHSADAPSAQKKGSNKTTSGKAKKTGIDLFKATVQSQKILLQPDRKAEDVQFVLYNARNNKVLSVHRKYINQGDTFALRTPELYPGTYELVIFSKEGKQVIKFKIK